MTKPGFQHPDATRAKIGAAVKTALATNARWRAPPGFEREYQRLRAKVGADTSQRHGRSRRGGNRMASLHG